MRLPFLSARQDTDSTPNRGALLDLGCAAMTVTLEEDGCRIVAANGRAGTLFQIAPSRLIGLDLTALFGPLTQGFQRDAFLRDLRARRLAQTRLVLHRADGSPIAAMLSGLALDGTPQVLVAVMPEPNGATGLPIPEGDQASMPKNSNCQHSASALNG